MGSFKRIATLVLVLFYLSDKVAESDPDTTVVYFGCNAQDFSGWPDESYYHDALEQVFHDLITQTPISGYSHYCTFQVENGNGLTLETFYGHGACNGEIEISYCANCLIAAAGLSRNNCPSNMGATFQLGDCRLRYETYQFTDQ
ncbi:antifungal protein ginkbilobin-like protein [Eucalyptus grandis]|uniref:antifungal protein ginkbilobin-like protein n=1 Tax=Eucalyptus grandis TaxID=71139 RepID=UPI00192EA6D6|nr:antifungal protein ginkbilobin-like protein [Eucalyptus grandis]